MIDNISKYFMLVGTLFVLLCTLVLVIINFSGEITKELMNDCLKYGGSFGKIEGAGMVCITPETLDSLNNLTYWTPNLTIHE